MCWQKVHDCFLWYSFEEIWPSFVSHRLGLNSRSVWASVTPSCRSVIYELWAFGIAKSVSGTICLCAVSLGGERRRERKEEKRKKLFTFSGLTCRFHCAETLSKFWRTWWCYFLWPAAFQCETNLLEIPGSNYQSVKYASFFVKTIPQYSVQS